MELFVSLVSTRQRCVPTWSKEFRFTYMGCSTPAERYSTTLPIKAARAVSDRSALRPQTRKLDSPVGRETLVETRSEGSALFSGTFRSSGFSHSWESDTAV